MVLALRYDVSIPVARKNYAKARDTATQWAAVRRLDGGDTMKASEMLSMASVEDRRDATFIRVSSNSIASLG